ncbi:MAG: Tad protein, partial [Chloroflexi bacterium]|nr:Tad protein [Chloroflexota bacterium]
MTALLAFTALVLNVGAYLVERRGLQNAADAAALAAARRMLDEQATRSLQDDQVAQEALRLANMNGADVGGARQMEALYLDESGAVLATVGATGRFPATATGVRITLSGPYASILGAFLGGATIQASATAQADVRPSPFPNAWTNAVPIGVPLAAFQAGAAFDLYDQTTAENSYGVSDYRPFLDLANEGNTGAGYSA